MSLLSRLRKACITLPVTAALSLPLQAKANSIRDYYVNPQVTNLTEAIEYFEATEIPRIRFGLRTRITLNTSYQKERKQRVQEILLNSGLISEINNPGCFDKNTARAIRKLQKKNRIRPMDGAVGETTAEAISSLGEFSLEQGVTLWPDATCNVPNPELVSEIQRNLMLLNFMNDNIPNGILDDETVNALRRYKEGNAINNSVSIDSQLINHLSMPSGERLDLLRQALRQHSRLRGDSQNRVYVNIPEFKFRYYYGGKVQFEMDLVVGAITNDGVRSNKWHTNVQRGYIEDIMINPWWNVPEGALTQEVREDLKKDRHLRERMQQLYHNRWIFNSNEVIGTRFRHIPGPDNPLGRIAYNFHGGQGELIHDTPFRRLFNKVIREGSHGCMRSNRPVEFALKLRELGFFEQDLTGLIERINPDTGLYQTDAIELNDRIPVNVVYSLAWAENIKSGLIAYFPNDIYRHNKTITIPGND